MQALFVWNLIRKKMLVTKNVSFATSIYYELLALLFN